MIELITFLAVVIIAILVWRLWKPRPKRAVEPNTARLYFFYTDWCGWSKKTMPEWEKIEQEIQKTPLFGKTRVEAVRVDGDKDRKTTELYEVDAYPVIKLETSDSIYEYHGSRTAESIKAFLRETLGKESESL